MNDDEQQGHADEYISAEQAAILAKRSVQTICRWRRAGRLPSYDVAGRTRYKRSDLARLLEPSRHDKPGSGR